MLVPSVYYTSSLAHIRIHLLRHWATCATTSTFYAARYSLHHHSGSLSGKRLKSESQQTVRCAQMKAFVIILHVAHISQTRTLHSTGSSWRLQLQRITCLLKAAHVGWFQFLNANSFSTKKKTAKEPNTATVSVNPVTKKGCSPH